MGELLRQAKSRRLSAGSQNSSGVGDLSSTVAAPNKSDDGEVRSSVPTAGDGGDLPSTVAAPNKSDDGDTVPTDGRGGGGGDLPSTVAAPNKTDDGEVRSSVPTAGDGGNLPSTVVAANKSDDGDLPSTVPTAGGDLPSMVEPPKGDDGELPATGTGPKKNGDLPSDAARLLELNPPLLLRREQLNANFRRGKGGGDEEEEDEPKEEPSSSAKKALPPKAKAKSTPKAKAKVKAKSVKKIDPPKEPVEAKDAKTSESVGDAVPDTTPPKKRKEEKKADEDSQPKRVRTGVTWARRYPPQDPVLLVRYQCIKNVFEAEIQPKVQRQSSFQDWFGIWGFVFAMVLKSNLKAS